MPIVSGNDPSPRKGGSRWGWLIFLVLAFGPTLVSTVRRLIGNRLTSDQLLIVGGGLLALVALAVIVQRINGDRSQGASTLPTAYPPPTASTPGLPPSRPPYLPPRPAFEPMVTGKVIVVGVLGAAVLAGAAVLLLVVGG